MGNQWTADEKKRVKQAFLALGELHGKQISVDLTLIYFRFFERYTANAVMQAIEMAVQKLKSFPMPAEIIELLNEDPEEGAYRAWTIFHSALRHLGKYTTVFFEDGRTSALIEYFDGWANICMTWTEKEIAYRREEFVKAYKAFKTMPEPKRHIGLSEHQASIEGLPWTGEWLIIGKDGTYNSMLRIECSLGILLDIPAPPKQLTLPHQEEKDNGEPSFPLFSCPNL